MENNNKSNADATEAPKKIGLAEAAKRMIEQKKQAQQQGKGQKSHIPPGQQKMRSQQTKKINNQRKKMGV